MKCYILSIAVCGAENWALQKVDQKYLESFEMLCWRRVEISWTIRVRNEVLHSIKEERNFLQTVKKRKTNWICHILHGNCLLIHVTEGKVEGKDTSDGKKTKKMEAATYDLKGKEWFLEIK